MTDKVLRVNTFTNFNFTDKEFAQLDKLAEEKPWYKIFVNANSYNELRGKYPVVVTLNPPIDRFVEPRGDLSLIRACRIKYVADGTPKVKEAFKKAMEWSLAHKIPVLVTYMRFRSIETLDRYTTGRFSYVWAKNYFRQVMKKHWDHPLIYHCDLKEQGCPTCGNCARLSYGCEKADVFSINLSTSGMCIYNCPDCYVKTISQWHHGQICMDKIQQNSKQKGDKKFKAYKYGQRTLSFDTYAKFTKGKEQS
jgi:hypothetical protein